MALNTTFSKARRQRASTLVELLITVGISSIILAASGSLMLYTARSLEGISNYLEMATESRLALDRMSREIRKADRLISHSTNQLVFDYEGSPLAYTYDADGKRMTRSYLNLTNETLTGCEFFSFSVFQRNNVAGTFDQYPVGTAHTAKIVELSWICSRDIIGAAANSESVHSSKIVMRNQ